MDDFFSLVRSLQKSEKRFFRLFASRHVKGDNNSLRLFDSVEAQKEYDEKALKKQFAGTSLATHFAFNKQYLYKLILRSLHQYYSHAGAEEIIREQIHHIKILFDRRLLNPCERLINKTIKLAQKHEAWHELIRLYEWKLELISSRLFRGYSEKDLKEIEAETQFALRALSEYLHIYTSQRLLYFHAETRGILLARSEKSRYLKMAAEIRNKKPVGFRARLYREHFLELANRNLSGQSELPETHIHRIFELLEQNAHIAKDHPREYLTSVYNYGIHKLYSRDSKGAAEIADKLNAFAASVKLSPGLQYAALQLHAILQTGIFQRELRYREAVKYFDEYLKKIRPFEGLEPNYSREKVIWYVMGNLSFSTGNYKPAIKYMSHITSEKLSNERNDLDNYARIIQLLSFFVSGSTLSLESMTRTVRKSLAGTDNLFRIEQLVLDFVTKNNTNIHDKTLMGREYKLLLTELKYIDQHGSKEEKLALQYIDLVRWAEEQAGK